MIIIDLQRYMIDYDMIDYVFANRPRYLLVDEIDKMSPKDQSFLLNLMETGIVTETKYDKTRLVQMKTSVFATSNKIKKLSTPLQSRFFIVQLAPYTYEQFCSITEKLLSRHKMQEGVTRRYPPILLYIFVVAKLL